MAATSGEGCRAAVAVSGQGERAAVAVPGDGEAAVPDKRTLFDSVLEYPCTERLRWRRLLAHLREHGCDQIYDVAKDKLRLIFHVEDLVEKVKAGQFEFEEAYHYACNFAPIQQSSYHAELLTVFLNYLMAIDRFADGNTVSAGAVSDWFGWLYRHPAVLSKYPCLATLVADVLFLRPHHVRNSLDWQLVRNKAAEMVSKAPDLQESVTRAARPSCTTSRPRRQVKKIGKKQSTDIAQFYLQIKKRLLSSAQMEYHDYSGSARKVMLVELFENVLQAGQHMVLKQGHLPEYLSRGVFTHQALRVCKSIPGHMMIEQGHRPQHASNQGKILQAVQRMVLNQGHPPEYLSRAVFPLETVLAYKPIPDQMMIGQGHRPEHASNQAMKLSRFQEPLIDTTHQGNALKRPCITGNFVKN